MLILRTSYIWICNLDRNIVSHLEFIRSPLFQLELLSLQIERSYQTELERNGLIVKKALYGKLNTDNPDDCDVITVTQQVQAMIKDSKLVIPATSTLVSY